ncbi:MAG: CBS domain-containing protein [bacterium]
MQRITAGDIMIPLNKYPHLPYWFTLRQALVEMEKSVIEMNDRKSLPRVVLVFNEQYELMGMVRRRDILRGLEPEFLVDKPLEYRKKLFDVDITPALAGFSYEELMSGVEKRADRPVSDVMVPIEQTANHDDHIFKVIYEMNVHDLSLLPVLEDGRVIGVVRSVDVFHQVAKLLM